MGLTGKLLEVSRIECPICKKEYGQHSKKQNLKCLHTSNWNLYDVISRYTELEQENIQLRKKLGVYVEEKDAKKE